MTLDLTRLPALVWLAYPAAISGSTLLEIETVDEDGPCFNSACNYIADIDEIKRYAYRIIYYDTLKELLPEEFI